MGVSGLCARVSDVCLYGFCVWVGNGLCKVCGGDLCMLKQI